MPKIPADLTASLDDLEGLLGSGALEAWASSDDDLALVRETRARLERRYTLAVVGEFSSGKSYLLNALLGKTRYDERGTIAGLLATDINPSTATITELEYGLPEIAVAKYPSGREERIPMDRLSRFVAVGKDDDAGALHEATAHDDGAPNFVVVKIDSSFLRAGFVVADTPGLASLNPAHRRATLSYLPRTDAVLYLIDTQQPFTDGDAAFLGLIGEHVRTIFIVQTKIDLWRMPEADGREAWQAARDRIAARAARFAPRAEVYSVSARDYAAGALDADAERTTASGFPELLGGLERSLEERVQRARVDRANALAGDLTHRLSACVRRASALGETGAPELRAALERASGELLERERSLGRERDDVARSGAERRAWIAANGAKLAERAARALGSAIDVADIERVRDRGRFHSLVDGALGPVWKAFAAEISGDVARELERIAKTHPQLRVADIAARGLGGEPGAGAWSRDLASGIASTIVLGAIGGPSVTFVHGVAQAFAAHAHGTYMKRELGRDLADRLFPALESEVAVFCSDLARRVARAYDDVSAAIERERVLLRAETLEPIEQALAVANDPGARRAALERLAAVAARLAGIDERLARIAPLELRDAAAPEAAGAAESGKGNTPFDADAYDLGLRPERYRVVVLGALRRGKSSLINAIAGTRLLSDDAASEALFPIHVRYGERERAYALERRGEWRVIAMDAAVAQAARSPVLIETPWRMPRELVLVHAPAFDSGNEEAEAIAIAAARHASETLGLFSRQLSDRELALYARVAEFGKPMLLAHTIADNETANERRTVVDLAARYVRERGLSVARIFTISALDYFEAAQMRRAPAGWNELPALRDTLQAHAEEHMSRSAQRERLAAGHHANAQAPQPAVPPHEERSGPRLRGALVRLLGRRK
jgi:predicted GTPase